jgi:tetratricopeptide (TPR) repeat protein
MAMETDPENASARLGMAIVLQAQGKTPEAIASLGRAVNRGIATPDLLASMAGAYTDEGRMREAAEIMLRALRELPDDPDLMSYLGYLYESGGNPQEAVDAYSAALKINPRQTDALLGKGRNLLAGGDAGGAAEAFGIVLESDPESLQAWYGTIQAYRQARNNAAAERACLSCLERNAADPYCREQLAFLRMEAADYRQSAMHLQVLLRGGIASKSILDGLAFSLLKTGDYLQATGLFESSVNRYGKDEWIYSNLGYLYRCRSDLTSSIAAYRKARDMAPESPERNHDLGYVLYLARQYEGAVRPFQTALRFRPDWGEAHYNLAMNYWQLGQFVLALTHARLAQEKGIEKAAPVARALTRYLGQGTPGAVPANRPRKRGSR